MGRKKKQPDQEQFLPEGLTRALAQRRPGVDSEEFLLELIDVWGGTRKLSQDIYREFQEAKAGGIVRARVIEMVQRLIITNTKEDLGRTINPADLTDEELLQIAKQYLERVTDAGSAVPETEQAEP